MALITAEADRHWAREFTSWAIRRVRQLDSDTARFVRNVNRRSTWCEMLLLAPEEQYRLDRLADRLDYDLVRPGRFIIVSVLPD